MASHLANTEDIPNMAKPKALNHSLEYTRKKLRKGLRKLNLAKGLPEESQDAHLNPPHLGNLNFMDLPGEIRNRIYAEAIFPASDIVTFAPEMRVEDNGGDDRPFKRHIINYTGLDSAFFRLSKRIRAEALSWLCAHKHIRIIGAGTALFFLKDIGIAHTDLHRMTIEQHYFQDYQHPEAIIKTLCELLSQLQE